MIKTNVIGGVYIKKTALFFLGLFLICTVVLFYMNGNTGQNSVEHQHQNEKEENIVDKEEITPNEIELLNTILSNAKQGKLPDKNIFVGKTDINEVIGRFGSANQKEKIGRGTYSTYENHAFVVGFDDEGLVFEVRSYEPYLDQIHYDVIFEKLEKPAAIRYYKDKEVDQIILDYKLPHNYELKFILPRPTDENPNPTVHHTSVSIMNNQNNGVPSNHNQSSSVDQYIKNMSLNEKIGQMIFSGIEGTVYTNELKNLVQQYKIGGFIFYSDNLKSKSQSVKLINSLKKSNKQNPLPIIFGVDQEGGRISRLLGNIGNIPTNAQIGKVNNPKFSYEIGKILGEQVKTFGFNLDFAPVLDINSNPKNPVIGDRSFGKNASVVSRLGIETMKGIKSEQVIPVIKHFPGHGDTSVDSHLDLPVVGKSYKAISSFEYIPFRNAIQQKADVVMIAHILLPKIDAKYPSSMSKKLITNSLRNDLQFNGVVMTDDMTMDAIDTHYNLEKAAVKSIQAGSDMIMVAHDTNKVKSVFKAIQTAVKNGSISEERLNQSVKRIIILKQKYKLNDQPVPNYSTEALLVKTNKVLKKYYKEQ